MIEYPSGCDRRIYLDKSHKDYLLSSLERVLVFDPLILCFNKLIRVKDFQFASYFLIAFASAQGQAIGCLEKRALY